MPRNVACGQFWYTTTLAAYFGGSAGVINGTDRNPTKQTTGIVTLPEHCNILCISHHTDTFAK